jgi:hypothetical protein
MSTPESPVSLGNTGRKKAMDVNFHVYKSTSIAFLKTLQESELTYFKVAAFAITSSIPPTR